MKEETMQYRKYASDFEHKRGRPYAIAKSQAKFRNEEWNLTFEDFCKIWHSDEDWEKRGRGRDALIMTRIDEEKAWEPSNIQLIKRYDQLMRTMEKVLGKPVNRKGN